MSTDESFVSHGFTGRVRLLSSLPRVSMTQSVHDDMWAIVHSAGSNEVGWLGLVEREGSLFRIVEVFVPDQTVSPVSTHITTQGQSDVVMELLARQDGAQLCSHLRFWGHSHVRMSTSPSGQDDFQLAQFMGACDWFVRGIANQQGRFEFTVFLREQGVVCEDVPWQIERSVDQACLERWQARVQANARPEFVMGRAEWTSSGMAEVEEEFASVSGVGLFRRRRK